MAVNQRMHQLLPPVRDHVEPVPRATFLGRKTFDYFGQRRKDGGALCRALDDVVDGVRERFLLKAAVDVPTGPANMSASGGQELELFPASCYFIFVFSVELIVNKLPRTASKPQISAHQQLPTSWSFFTTEIVAQNHKEDEGMVKSIRIFFLIGPFPTSFSFIYGLSKQTPQFLPQINVKISPVSDARIRTHNLLNMNLLQARALTQN